jgi:hypothetical protein
MPCSPLKVNRCLGGTCRLHRQGRRMSQTPCLLPALCWFFALMTSGWKRHVPPKRRLAFSDYMARGENSSNRFFFCSLHKLAVFRN